MAEWSASPTLSVLSLNGNAAQNVRKATTVGPTPKRACALKKHGQARRLGGALDRDPARFAAAVAGGRVHGSVRLELLEPRLHELSHRKNPTVRNLAREVDHVGVHQLQPGDIIGDVSGDAKEGVHSAESVKMVGSAVTAHSHSKQSQMAQLYNCTNPSVFPARPSDQPQHQPQHSP